MVMDQWQASLMRTLAQLQLKQNKDARQKVEDAFDMGQMEETDGEEADGSEEEGDGEGEGGSSSREEEGGGAAAAGEGRRSGGAVKKSKKKRR